MTYTGIKGVIFDMGSTLLEFEKRPWVETMLIGQTYGHERLTSKGIHLPPLDEFNTGLDTIKFAKRDKAKETLDEWFIDDAFIEYLHGIGVNNVEENAKILSEEFYRAVREIVEPLPGAQETLEELSNRGLKIGMISNTIFPPHEHDRDLDEYGMKPFLPIRIYSCEFGFRKPKPEIYAEGLRLLDLPAEQIVFVGDRYIEDVKGPQDAGMKAVLRKCELREYPNPLPDGFPAVSQLPELLDIIA
ncbi:MAG: HAD family hydrolase [Candidatus Zixiibacteriota bacterium]